MENNFDIFNYWSSIVYQNPIEIRNFFDDNAIIYWHNTKEIFNLDNFVEVNCKYPDKWDFEIERYEIIDNLYICVVRVFNILKSEEHYVVSFIRLKDKKIICIDEYWGENSQPPDWRL